MRNETNDREAVLRVLQPHLSVLEQVFSKAWTRLAVLLKNIEGSPADIGARSRANILYDFIVAEAVRVFLGKDGVRVMKKRGLLVVHFQDRVALRFKKFRNMTMRTSSNSTRQTELFAAQTLEYGSALTPMVHVTAGYLLDSLALDIKHLAITCMLNGEHMWAPIDIMTKAKPVKKLPVKEPAAVPTARVRSTRKQAEKEKDGEGAPS